MLKLAVVKETRENEKRVAITPQIVNQLSHSGIQVMIESNAGEGSGFTNRDYQANGAQIAHNKQQLYQNADIVCWFKRPKLDMEEIRYVNPQTTLIGFLDPLKPGGHIAAYKDRKITAFAWELLPNQPELKSMDAFSKMGKLAGKVAYQNARDTVKQLDLVPESLTVLVVGAGNAGMAAAENAHEDGHQVIVASTSIRYKLTVENDLRGRFLSLTDDNLPPGQASSTLLGVQQKKLWDEIHQSKPDIIITSARRYKQKAPVLLPEEYIAELKTGTVIEDLTASVGGNTAYTQLDKSIQTDNGILVRNRSNYPSQVPVEASHDYADCLFQLIRRTQSSEFSNIEQALKFDPLLNSAVVSNAA